MKTSAITGNGVYIYKTYIKDFFEGRIQMNKTTKILISALALICTLGSVVQTS